jgi:fermentation-respiration switch protein FrsA (DUF1100 family)
VRVAVLFEEKFIYFPSKYPGGMWELDELSTAEAETVLEIEDCWLRAQDGVRLNGWFCNPGRKESGLIQSNPIRMVFLFFHGNAGNITDRYDMILRLMTLPVRVFIIDYRGYGKSEGRPSEGGLYLDAKAAWHYLVSKRVVDPSQIILFGKSLGGAVAIDLATHVEAAGLIVQSSFTSIPDMAKRLIPILPKFLIRTRMDSVSKIARVSCPKLFIHSPADEIVPYALGRRLFQTAAEPKAFYDVSGAPHNETYRVGGEAYLDVLRRFVQTCAGDTISPRLNT